eukprot:scaffold125934_cov63-Phaeocystis_antarctica.AAC.1
MQAVDYAIATENPCNRNRVRHQHVPFGLVDAGRVFLSSNVASHLVMPYPWDVGNCRDRRIAPQHAGVGQSQSPHAMPVIWIGHTIVPAYSDESGGPREEKLSYVRRANAAGVLC